MQFVRAFLLFMGAAAGGLLATQIGFFVYFKDNKLDEHEILVIGVLASMLMGSCALCAHCFHFACTELCLRATQRRDDARGGVEEPRCSGEEGGDAKACSACAETSPSRLMAAAFDSPA